MTVISGGYATKAGASKALRRTDRNFYAGQDLSILERPSAEWARIGIDKAEFVLVATPTQKD